MDHIDTLLCVSCRAALFQQGRLLTCSGCRKTYPIIDGIPSFVTELSPHAQHQEEIWSQEAHDSQPRASSDRELHFHLKREQAFLHEIPLKKGTRILDIGAGKGVTMTLLGPGFTYTAVDISMESLRRGRAFIGEILPTTPVQYIHADAGLLPFPEASYDAVICFDIFEHVQDKRTLLCSLQSLLAPQGLLLVHMPVRDRFLSLEWIYKGLFPEKYRAAEQKLGHQEHLKMTAREFSRLVAESGFSDVSVRKCDSFFVPLWDYVVMPRLVPLIVRISARMAPQAAGKRKAARPGSPAAGRTETPVPRINPDGRAPGRRLFFGAAKTAYLKSLVILSYTLILLDRLIEAFGIGAGVYARARKP
jgi:ubiquinone/menaquinone biosynthesis C-methylase UbiE/uncharacterized protein YbaR (Trm112 family)